MKYTQPSFSVGGSSEQYRKNFDSIDWGKPKHLWIACRGDAHADCQFRNSDTQADYAGVNPCECECHTGIVEVEP